jgi:hypothetical protein
MQIRSDVRDSVLFKTRNSKFSFDTSNEMSLEFATISKLNWTDAIEDSYGELNLEQNQEVAVTER